MNSLNSFVYRNKEIYACHVHGTIQCVLTQTDIAAPTKTIHSNFYSFMIKVKRNHESEILNNVMKVKQCGLHTCAKTILNIFKATLKDYRI
jgi:hypothetical protein